MVEAWPCGFHCGWVQEVMGNAKGEVRESGCVASVSSQQPSIEVCGL